MISFDDVKRTPEPVLFFFPDGHHDVLAHFLTLAGFVHVANSPGPVGRDEFRILSRDETREMYPDVDVPKIPDHPSLAGNPDAYDEPLTLVSRLDPSDLERKLWEIYESDDAIEYEDRQVETLLAQERERDARLAGWGPGLTREREDAR